MYFADYSIIFPVLPHFLVEAVFLQMRLSLLLTPARSPTHSHEQHMPRPACFPRGDDAN